MPLEDTTATLQDVGIGDGAELQVFLLKSVFDPSNEKELIKFELDEYEDVCPDSYATIDCVCVTVHYADSTELVVGGAVVVMSPHHGWTP